MTAPYISRKFTVFVSSVTKEFDEARKILWEATYHAGHIPAIWESLPATSDDLDTLIHRRIEESDIFVILIGQDYGTRARTDVSRSFIDVELDHATRRGLPIIAFEIGPAETRPATPLDSAAKDIEQRYQRLLERIRSLTTPLTVSRDKDGGFGKLRNEYETALLLEASRLHRGGWIPAHLYDSDVDVIALAQAVSSNPFFKRFVHRLNSFTTISDRTNRYPAEKTVMADFFWDNFLPRMYLAKIRKVFFESGSTIAYVSQEFVARLYRPWVRTLATELSIQTNNVLTYLDFVLINSDADPIDVSLFPPAPAEEYYGATFGPFTSLVDMFPPEEPRPLEPGAKVMVKAMMMKLEREYSENGIILMTASGLETDSTSKFLGPHVGSYYNALMKRTLLGCGVPVVLFLEDSKLPRPFKVGECFGVCDNNAAWKRMCKTASLAIMTCTTTDSGKEEKMKLLMELGFQHFLSGRKQGEVVPLLAANSHFASRFQMSVRD